MTNGRPVYVHRNGLAVWLKYAMNAKSCAPNSSTDLKLARLSTLRTRILNQISTWLSHDVCFGTYTNWSLCDGSLKKAARVAIDCNTLDTPFSPNSAVMP